MAFNEALAERVRNELANLGIREAKEVRMFGGLAFMVNDKMCVVVGGNEGETVMVRVGSERYDELVTRDGALPTIMRDRPMRGYIDLEAEGQQDLASWVEIAVAFNKELTA